MLPQERPWSSPEPPDPLALLDGAVWDLLGQDALPPVSGGALPGFLEDAWDWTKDNLLDPAGTFLNGVLRELGRIVSGAVTTVLSWLLKWVYHIVRFSLWYAVPSAHRLRFPSVFKEDTQSPYEYASRIFRIVGSVVESLVTDAIGWLWGLVKAALGYAAKGFGSLTSWVWQRTQDVTLWLWDLVKASLGYAAKGFGSLTSWVWQRTHDVALWLWDVVQRGLGYAAKGFGSLVGWVWQRTQDVTLWLWDLVKAGLGYAAKGFGSLVGWIWQRTHDVALWLWDLVKRGLGYAAAGFGSLTSWVWQRTHDVALWLWDQVEGGLKWAWDNVISKIPEGIVRGAAEIGKLIRESFEWLVNSAFEPFVDVVSRKLAIPGKLIRAEYASLEELIDDMMDPPRGLMQGLSGLLMIPAIFGAFVSVIVGGISGPLTEPILQEYRRMVGVRIPPYAMLRDGMLRGFLTGPQVADALQRSGFDFTNTKAQMELFWEIPGPTDLVRMGVREVFTPEIAERFGQFEDLPVAFVEWMGKQGYTEEWARNYWAAHWDLPSITQGFEMYHRDVIPEEELQVLLRALDVMPYWRDKLTDIAYRVITRVDVRRMYAEGVFNRDQVLRVYRDLGYKPEDAEALTEFVVLRYPPKGAETADDLRSVTASTIKQALARRLITEDDALEGLVELEYSRDDAQLVMSIWQFDWTQDPSLRSDVDPKGLARSVIEKAYERRLIDLNGGVRELGELGYTPEDARLLLQLVDLRLEEQLADLEIDGLVGDYQDGVITDAQFAAALADLHVPEARVEFLLRKEILSRQAKRRRLTLAQMKKAVGEDLMGVGEYRARLDVMGYNARDAEILVALNVESV